MSRTLMRNGMRQPQLRNCSVGSSETKLNTPVDIKSPSGTPVCGKLPKNPRFCGGAYSTTRRTAPPHSPPTPNPCRKRIATSRRGAQTPMDSYVGRMPIMKVATPIISSVATSADLRPILSPK
jgi:hypothetical protein